jgi:hypothetical protein
MANIQQNYVHLCKLIVLSERGFSLPATLLLKYVFCQNTKFAATRESRNADVLK